MVDAKLHPLLSSQRNPLWRVGGEEEVCQSETSTTMTIELWRLEVKGALPSLLRLTADRQSHGPLIAASAHFANK